jgi:hypothetical protein
LHQLLDHVELVVPCHRCEGSYTVLASAVLASQRVRATGCASNTGHESAPFHFAHLVEPEALASLEQAWRGFLISAVAGGASCVMLHGDTRVEVPPKTPVAALEFDADAVATWEDEGGGCPSCRAK